MRCVLFTIESRGIAFGSLEFEKFYGRLDGTSLKHIFNESGNDS